MSDNIRFFSTSTKGEDKQGTWTFTRLNRKCFWDNTLNVYTQSICPRM